MDTEERDKVERKLGTGTKPAKAIYNCLLHDVIKNGDEFKLSRAEEKYHDLDWEQVSKNHRLLKRVSHKVKETSFLMKHDMLPGLNTRRFRHRVRVGPHNTRCNRLLGPGGHICEKEVTMLHFFSCPALGDVFAKLKRKILEMTDNCLRFPPVTDIQFLLGDFSASKVKIRTGIV